jgi:hypothetical protein
MRIRHDMRIRDAEPFEIRAAVRPHDLRSRLRPESSLRRQLERRYRAALSGAVVAKAYYLAQVGERFSTPVAVERARRKWERLESRRNRLAAQMWDYENAEPPRIVDLFADPPTAMRPRQGGPARL